MRTEVGLDIKNSVQQFYQDTLATAKDWGNHALICVHTYNKESEKKM